MRNYVATLLLLLMLLPYQGKAQNDGSVLSLEDVKTLALSKNPQLLGLSFQLKATEAGILQAGLVPNPELEFEIGNFAGSREFESGEAWEATALISLPLELGGKRKARLNVAQTERDLADIELQAMRLEVAADATKAYYQVLAAQETVGLLGDMLQNQTSIHAAVSDRVQAGKVSRIQTDRSNVSLALAAVELEQEKIRLESIRRSLAEVWGAKDANFERVTGDLYLVRPVPKLESLVDSLPGNPEFAHWETQIKREDALIKLEKAHAIPDISAGFGVRHTNETSNNSYLATLSIPVPMIDRNQGAIKEAGHNQARETEYRHAAQVRVYRQLYDTYQRLNIASIKAATLKSSVLPGASNVFQAISEGYQAGKFGYLDVLDAQQTLFEAQAQYIETLLQYHESWADLERLAGGPIVSSGPESELKGETQ